MAVKEYWVGTQGPFEYEDTDTDVYTDAAPVEGFRCAQMHVEDAPTQNYHVAHKSYVDGHSSIGYAMNLMAANLATLTDGATIYFGGAAGLAPSVTSQAHRVYVPRTGSITRAYVTWYGGTAGSNEQIDCYLFLNATSSVLIGSVSTNVAFKVFYSTALNEAVNMNSFFCIKFVFPTWATNPANVTVGGVVYIT